MAPATGAPRVLAWPRLRSRFASPGPATSSGGSSSRPAGCQVSRQTNVPLGNLIQRRPSGFRPRPDAPATPALRWLAPRSCSSIHPPPLTGPARTDSWGSRPSHRTSHRQKAVRRPSEGHCRLGGGCLASRRHSGSPDAHTHAHGRPLRGCNPRAPTGSAPATAHHSFPCCGTRPSQVRPRRPRMSP